MAKARSPKELRARARELQKQAKLEEDKLYMKAGRLAAKELNKKGAFISDDIGKIRTEINNFRKKINTILGEL